MAGLKANVPQCGNEACKRRVCAGRQLAVQQKHEIDIRSGVQLATAIASDGNQGNSLGEIRGKLLPDVDKQPVDQLCPESDEMRHRVAGHEPLREPSPGE